MTKLVDLFDPLKLVEHLANDHVKQTWHPTVPMFILNYTSKAQYEHVWDEVTTQCRGLIVGDDGTVLARPFRKFFNLAEPECLAPELPYRVFDKMDGSLGIMYGEQAPAIATRGSFTSEQAHWATAHLCQHYGRYTPPPGVTLLFEIIYPGNRIVVDYDGQEALILLAAIDIATGRDLEVPSDRHGPHISLANAVGWPGPVVWEHPPLAIGELAAVEEQDNREGFVVRWDDGTRAKVKFAEYLRLHRLVTGVSSRSIWETLSLGQPLDELLDRVPDEFAQWVKDVAAGLGEAFWAIRDKATDDMGIVPRGNPADRVIRKAQAAVITQCQYPAVMFKLLDGKPVDDLIWKMIRPERTTPFRDDPDDG